MAKKADNYFVKVAKYQKEHPRADRSHAMKMVSKEISGTKKRKPVAAKKTPRKKTIIKTERITAIGGVKKSVSATSAAIRISNKIDDLTSLLRNTSGVEAKNKVKRLINAEHDKLDAITKKLKSA